jgi:hypothetical protein
MLENTVKWRREFKPDQLDEEKIRLEVKISAIEKKKKKLIFANLYIII